MRVMHISYLELANFRSNSSSYLYNIFLNMIIQNLLSGY